MSYIGFIGGLPGLKLKHVEGRSVNRMRVVKDAGSGMLVDTKSHMGKGLTVEMEGWVGDVEESQMEGVSTC